MNELVKIEKLNGNGLVVSSRVVAKGLGRRHDHILRDIDVILETPNLGSLIFPSKYKAENQKRTYKEYLLTKDGFILYMFNIQGHNEFKIKYINEFNRMEKLLREEEEKKLMAKQIMIPLNKIAEWQKLEEQFKNFEEIKKNINEKIEEIDIANLNLIIALNKFYKNAYEIEKTMKNLK